MATCFVIQPFDGGQFDKRYEESIGPAITAAGLAPYRVDQDPSVSIPIQRIEEGIREAALCVAEITTDNPNVWFELGFAIACRKEVVLICSDERKSHFPFDVQHRSIIKYVTESKQDYACLEQAITTKIRALLAKEEQIDSAKAISPVADVAGLSPHEMVALVSIAQNLDVPSGSVSAHQIRNDMERSGFTKIAAFIALAGLKNKQLVLDTEEPDYNGNPLVCYRLTDHGMKWLMANQHLLLLQHGDPK